MRQHLPRKLLIKTSPAEQNALSIAECLRPKHAGTPIGTRGGPSMNRGIIGTIIGVLVIIILVIVILQLT